jgi:hypothetical protein
VRAPECERYAQALPSREEGFILGFHAGNQRDPFVTCDGGVNIPRRVADDQ